MNLKRASDKELRAELARRDKVRRDLEMVKWQEWAAEHPCPDCGSLPEQVSIDAVEEYRFAPRDDEGRAMLYAPYEAGTTGGLRYEKTASCPSGHSWFIDEFVKWFDKPYEGPPMLGKR